MSKFFITGSLALGLGFAALATAEEPSVKGSSVTISGCVMTDKENSFVLTHVQEIAGPRSRTSEAELGRTACRGVFPEVSIG